MTERIKTGVVPKFEGEFFFLSNFYEAPFSWRGNEFRTAEHAFQAAKAYHIPDSTIDVMGAYWNKVVEAPDPAKAKYAGRSVNIDVKSWDAQKVQYMREIIHAKFYDVPGLAGQLVNTGVMLLVEGNTWGDKFWGRCEGKGLNTLGTILMEERGYWLHGQIKEPNNDS